MKGGTPGKPRLRRVTLRVFTCHLCIGRLGVYIKPQKAILFGKTVVVELFKSLEMILKTLIIIEIPVAFEVDM